MSKKDQDGIAESGQISEHAEYIAESTLMPETESRIPETESVDNSIGDGLPGGSAHGVKTAQVKKSSIKQNIPFIVIGVFVLFVGGSFGIKKLTQQPGGEVVVKKAPVESPVVQPTELKTEPTPALPPIAPQVPDTQEPLKGEASVSSVPATNPHEATSSSLPQQSVQPVTKSEIPKAVEAVAVTPSVKTTGISAPSQPVVRSVQPGSMQSMAQQVVAGEGLAAMKERLSATEQKLKDVQRDLQVAQEKAASVTPGTGQVCAPQSNGKVAVVPHKRHSRKRVASDTASKAPSIEEITTLNVKVIKNGLAWIELPSSKILTVREGDVIPDLGKVTKIDDRLMQVIAGSKRIEQK